MRGATVVFDLDGTMIDTSGDLTAALNHLLAKMGLPATSAGMVGATAGAGARAMIEKAATALNRHLDPAEMDPLVDDFIAYYSDHIAVNSKPFPGFEEALAWLASEGARLAVCTNKREDLAIKLLRELDLERHFHAIIGGNTLAVRKPDPGHLAGAIAAAGGVLNRSVMVGDSKADIAAARGAGVPVIAVSFGYADEPVANLQPDYIIHHFEELRPALKALLPGC